MKCIIDANCISQVAITVKRFTRLKFSTTVHNQEVHTFPTAGLILATVTLANISSGQHTSNCHHVDKTNDVLFYTNPDHFGETAVFIFN